MVNFQLSYAKKNKNNNMTVPSDLAFVIIIRDFNEFLPIVETSLWDKAIISKITIVNRYRITLYLS